ncbi:MAG: DUF1232 domain-containing protein [Burkholderiales bacterium]
MWRRLIDWAQALRRNGMTLWFASRDPETPVIAKLLALLIAAYALSPVDLIPDFIPILGYLDEVILLPLAIALCLKLLPQAVTSRARESAETWFAEKRAKPKSLFGAGLIVGLWILVTTFVGIAIFR